MGEGDPGGQYQAGMTLADLTHVALRGEADLA
jgi:hypothetical protein